MEFYNLQKNCRELLLLLKNPDADGPIDKVGYCVGEPERQENVAADSQSDVFNAI